MMSKDKLNNSISTLNAVEMCVLVHTAYLIEMKKKPPGDFFFILRKGRACLLANLKYFPII